MIRRFMNALALCSLLLFTATATPVLAWGPFDSLNCAQAPKSSVCSDKNTPNNNPLTGPKGIINSVIMLLAVISGVAAVILIIISGFKLITSSGDANEIASARRTLIYAVAGLIVIALATTIISFVIGHI